MGHSAPFFIREQRAESNEARHLARYFIHLNFEL